MTPNNDAGVKIRIVIIVLSLLTFVENIGVYHEKNKR